jgi:hypothetical protein
MSDVQHRIEMKLSLSLSPLVSSQFWTVARCKNTSGDSIADYGRLIDAYVRYLLKTLGIANHRKMWHLTLSCLLAVLIGNKPWIILMALTDMTDRAVHFCDPPAAWQKRHLPAVENIAKLLLRLRARAPKLLNGTKPDTSPCVFSTEVKGTYIAGDSKGGSATTLAVCVRWHECITASFECMEPMWKLHCPWFLHFRSKVDELFWKGRLPWGNAKRRRIAVV